MEIGIAVFQPHTTPRQQHTTALSFHSFMRPSVWHWSSWLRSLPHVHLLFQHGAWWNLLQRGGSPEASNVKNSEWLLDALWNDKPERHLLQKGTRLGSIRWKSANTVHRRWSMIGCLKIRYLHTNQYQFPSWVIFTCRLWLVVLPIETKEPPPPARLHGWSHGVCNKR